MGRRAGSALRREAGGLVDDDRRLVAVDDEALRVLDLGGAQRAARALRRAVDTGVASGGGTVIDWPGTRRSPGSVFAAVELEHAGPRPARDDVEADLGQVPLEPAVEPDVGVVVGGEVKARSSCAAASVMPAYSATMPPATDETAYAAARTTSPRTSIVTSSRLNAEKVVNPPSTPTPSSSRSGSPPSPSRTSAAGQQPHREAAGDVDHPRPERQAGAEAWQASTRPTRIAQRRADRAAEHDEDDRGQGDRHS